MGILTTISREQCCFTSLIISFRIVSRFHTMFAQLVRKRSPNCSQRFHHVYLIFPHNLTHFFFWGVPHIFPRCHLDVPSFSLDFTLIFYDFPSCPWFSQYFPSFPSFPPVFFPAWNHLSPCRATLCVLEAAAWGRHRSCVVGSGCCESSVVGGEPFSRNSWRPVGSGLNP